MSERIAADGKPFDVDNVGELTEKEVEVIQFLRPDGRRRRMAVPVGKEIVDLTKDLILSAEELTTGEIVIYCRLKNEPAEKEISEMAVNGPGEKSPTNVLIRLIKKKLKID